MAYDFKEIDPKLLQEEQDRLASNKSMANTFGGIADILSSGNSAGNYYLGRMNQNSGAAQKLANTVADSQVDPMKRQADLFARYKESKDAQKMKDEEARNERKKNIKSPESMQATAWLRKNIDPNAEPVTAEQFEQMYDAKKYNTEKAKAAVEWENKLKEIEAQGRENRKTAAAKALQEKAKPLRQLEGGQTSDIASLDSSLDQLKTFSGSAKGTEDFGLPGILNPLSALNPLRYISNTDTSNRKELYEKQRKAVAQTIGKSLEGGKLTDVDYEKYYNLFPDIDDPPDVKKNKLASIESLIKQQKVAKIDNFKSAGYDMSKFGAGNLEVPQNPLERSAENALRMTSAKAASGPPAGTVKGGYRFKGGDPNDKKNWEEVK